MIQMPFAKSKNSMRLQFLELSQDLLGGVNDSLRKSLNSVDFIVLFLIYRQNMGIRYNLTQWDKNNKKNKYDREFE